MLFEWKRRMGRAESGKKDQSQILSMGKKAFETGLCLGIKKSLFFRCRRIGPEGDWTGGHGGPVYREEGSRLTPWAIHSEDSKGREKR